LVDEAWEGNNSEWTLQEDKSRQSIRRKKVIPSAACLRYPTFRHLDHHHSSHCLLLGVSLFLQSFAVVVLFSLYVSRPSKQETASLERQETHTHIIFRLWGWARSMMVMRWPHDCFAPIFDAIPRRSILVLLRPASRINKRKEQDSRRPTTARDRRLDPPTLSSVIHHFVHTTHGTREMQFPDGANPLSFFLPSLSLFYI